MTEIGLVVMRREEFATIDECKEFIEAHNGIFTWDGEFFCCDYFYRCWDEGCNGKCKTGRYADVKDLNNKWNGFNDREHITNSGPTLFQGQYALVTKNLDECQYVNADDIKDDDWIIVVSAHT